MKFHIPLEPHTASRPKFSETTGRVSRIYMPQSYRKWRDEMREWLIEWLNDTDNQLLREMLYLPDGRPIRNPETNKLDDDFAGYLFKIVFVMPRTDGVMRAFPVASNTADLDNLFKAVTDGMFASAPFRELGLNDRWIQSTVSTKRYTMLQTSEKPHIEVEIKQIWADDWFLKAHFAGYQNSCLYKKVS